MTQGNGVAEPADVMHDSRVDAAGLLVADVACITCSYNLRTLARHTTCPECGRPVEQTLTQTNLQAVDWRWLHTFDRGITWVAVGLLVAAMVVVASAVMRVGAYVAGVRLLVVPLSAVPLIVGVWLLAQRPPSGVAFGGWWLRSLLRGASVAIPLLIELLVVLAVMDGFSMADNIIRPLLASLAIGAVVLWFCLVIGLAYKLQRVGKLLPRHKSVELVGAVQAIAGISIIVLMLGYALGSVGYHTGLPFAVQEWLRDVGMALLISGVGFVLGLQLLLIPLALIAFHLSLRKIIPEARRQQGG